MKNLIIESLPGNLFEHVAEKAKSLATETQNVEFDFNGIVCIVSPKTNLQWLLRDYQNAHRMEWKEIGYDCLPEYSEEIKIELERRNKIAEEKSERQYKESKKKENEERAAFNKKTEGITIELIDLNEWNDWKGKNEDGYGRCIFEYAEGWAKLMQVEMSKGKTIIECAEKTSHEMGFLGITGFMYGAAVTTLSLCWKHGEELRKWHNKEYNHEGEGVVNPAILTLESK